MARSALSAKTVVITGAGSGIGRCLALKLAKRGADVWALDIDKDGLSSLADDAEKFGHEIETRAADVTDPNSKNYLPLRDRVAVFDNDGTLWQEKPIYVQLAFVIDQIKILAPQHPEWKTEEPFRTLLNDPNPDLKSLQSTENLMKLL